MGDVRVGFVEARLEDVRRDVAGRAAAPLEPSVAPGEAGHAEVGQFDVDRVGAGGLVVVVVTVGGLAGVMGVVEGWGRAGEGRLLRLHGRKAESEEKMGRRKVQMGGRVRRD